VIPLGASVGPDFVSVLGWWTSSASSSVPSFVLFTFPPPISGVFTSSGGRWTCRLISGSGPEYVKMIRLQNTRRIVNSFM